MFNSITKKFGSVLDKIRGKKIITEDDFNLILREIRIAFLESDVSLSIIRTFIDNIKDKVIGQNVIKNVSSGQMVIKIINDELLNLLNTGAVAIDVNSYKPFSILMLGLQGQGKTSATVKLANRLQKKDDKKVLVVSLDTYRPAAQEQLEKMAKNSNIDSLSIVEGESPIQIVQRALNIVSNYDVVIYDTAGRMAIDTTMMNELKDLSNLIKPQEKLLVADSLMGQDALNIAKNFNESIGVSGIILTRLDADGKAGSVLSMRVVTGCSIRYISNGEKVNDFDVFYPERIVSRILDMGDVVTFVENAQESIDKKEAEEVENKIRKGEFDLDDFLKQLKNIKMLGGIKSLISFLPGATKLKDFLDQKNFDDKVFERQKAIIHSMTKLERKNPEILNSSRKFRIAKGSGTNVQDINSLLKKFKDIKRTTEVVGKMNTEQLQDIMNSLGNFKNQKL
ncbi:MAG: signal recognition particle protein [Rickettsiales bacterium]|jgi:signal recognition particle subunit SRP54|nr:signal recognition particle protein [Rickettsiales bacterium]